MSKLAYLECPTGIAGDMCLGAIVDAGVPLTYLVEKLNHLGIADEFQLRAEQVHRNGQQATKVYVDLLSNYQLVNQATSSEVAQQPPLYRSHSATETVASPESEVVLLPGHAHHQAHSDDHNEGLTSSDRHSHHSPTRHLPEIEQLILSAKLPSRAETWSLAVFRRLAQAEAAVHGIPPEQVHFHEVGATDAIVDIVGTCLGFDWLDIDDFYCSPLPTGGGTVRAAHGRLPVPAPAVLKLWQLRQIPIYSNGIQRELVTPTGAAIVTTLATQFGPPPAMTLQAVGLGAGSINLPIPNILRLWIGAGEGDGKSQKVSSSREHSHSPQPTAHSPHPSEETIVVLETQIDDLTPQAIGYVYEALLAAGALDVFTQAIGMKKSRPGILLTVICHPEACSSCEAIIFRETTTLGIRRSTQQRKILQREIQQVQTEYGAVRIKVAWSDAQESAMNVQPEYEDCAQLARQHHVPWREIHRLALASWYSVTQQGDQKLN